MPPKNKKNTTASSSSESDEITKTQTGTGLHLDCWPYNLWGKLKTDFTYGPLDRFRPFQSMVCLTDGCVNRHKKEGGLEVIPGFASVCEKYFPAVDLKLRSASEMRAKSPWVSSYHLRFNKEEDKPLYELVRKVQRIPQNWNPPPANNNLDQLNSADEMVEYVRNIVKEHDRLEYIPIKKGDYIFFDNRTAHRNSDANDMNRPRSVFYHAYSCAHKVNYQTIKQLQEKRKRFEHPDDFGTKFRMEQQFLKPEKDVVPLTPLGECLYNEQPYQNLLTVDDEHPVSVIDQILQENDHFLTQRHIDFFHRFGYVVVENIVTDADCDQLLVELCHYSTLAGCPISVNGKSVSQNQFAKIGGNFGAMVEFYYLPMQQQLRMSPALYTATVKLLTNTWCSTTPNAWNVPYECPLAPHIDPRKLWLYVDRMNFRLPDQ